MGRKLNFSEELATIMCYPLSFEIGGISSALKKVIRAMTVKNASIKKMVLDICKEDVYNGNFDSHAYGTDDPDEVMNMIEEDYDVVFFR